MQLNVTVVIKVLICSISLFTEIHGIKIWYCTFSCSLLRNQPPFVILGELKAAVVGMAND